MWRSKACEILEKTGRRAHFHDIVEFIEHRVRITSDLVFGDIQDTPPVKGIVKLSQTVEFSIVDGLEISEFSDEHFYPLPSMFLASILPS